MKRYILSLITVLSKLKCFWLLILISGLYPAILGVSAGQYVSGLIIGVAVSAFFSCQDQFLLRGAGDPVYLIQNDIRPHAYKLASRETLNAFGGIWSKVFHVSESMIKHLSRLIITEKKQINLKDAKLYKINGGNSVFAVLEDIGEGIRYGIPDAETKRRIWENKRVETTGVAELDKWRPGRDLVSIHYWPEQDKAAAINISGEEMRSTLPTSR